MFLRTQAPSPSSDGHAPTARAVSLVLHGKPFARVAANRALVGRNRSRSGPTAGRFTRHDVGRFINDAFARFHVHARELPSEPTTGARQNVMLAALTLSMLEALEADGIERGYAVELTSDVCWRFYRHWGNATKALTHAISRDHVRRLRLSVNAFMTYPFGRPGYQFDDVPEAAGRSLNITRCPVADYLGRHGAADLCAAAWCDLDYALAEMWDATLERSGTLVGGASCCDFRFRTAGVRANQVASTAIELPMLAWVVPPAEARIFRNEVPPTRMYCL